MRTKSSDLTLPEHGRHAADLELIYIHRAEQRYETIDWTNESHWAKQCQAIYIIVFNQFGLRCLWEALKTGEPLSVWLAARPVAKSAGRTFRQFFAGEDARPTRDTAWNKCGAVQKTVMQRWRALRISPGVPDA